jgi:hypothetical protein
MRFPVLNPTRLDVYKSTRIARPQRPFSGGRGTPDILTMMQVIREIPFYTESGGADVFNFRTLLTVNAAQVPSTQTDFPIAITLLLGANKILQTNGEDVRIVINGVTLLDYEIEEVNSVTGELVVWAKMPTIDDGDVVEVYYGNSTVSDAQNKAGLWSAYQYIFHMNNNPVGIDSVKDSGPFAGDASPVGIATQTAGKIGKAIHFDGTVWLLTAPGQTHENSATDMTLTAWVKVDPSIGFTVFVNKGFINAAYLFFAENAAGSGVANWRIRAPSGAKTAIGPTDVRDSTWHFLVGTWDDATLRFYVDGAQVGTFAYTGAFSNTTNPLTIAADFGGFGPVVGDLDDIKFIHTTQSPDWIETEFNNQDNFNTFFTTSAEEEAGIILLEIFPTTIPNTIMQVI